VARASIHAHVDPSCAAGTSSQAGGGAGLVCRPFIHRNTFSPKEITMNKSFAQQASSLALSAFFTVVMLAGIGVLADTSKPAAQMAGHSTAAPRA
jgi:hypothetical protein